MSKPHNFPWVDIEKDGPPPESGYYLVYISSRLITTTFFCSDHTYFDSYKDAITPLPTDTYGRWSRHFEHARKFGYRVTHWAYLPDPPDEEATQ